MTNKEAINILKQRQCCRECVADCKCEDCDKAFEMAIESLENSIDYRDLDDTILRLNEQGWEITRYEYKRIDGVLFEMKQGKELNNEETELY